MRAAALVAAIALTPAALPRSGVLIPGISLGGVRLGASEAQVRAAWGASHGVCSDCRRRTWYFNYAEFAPAGAGVAFRAHRAVALFTLWSPAGWHTTRGLTIGDAEARITKVYGALPRTQCGTYSALTVRRRGAVSSIYVTGGKVWGFGLNRPDEPVCH